MKEMHITITQDGETLIDADAKGVALIALQDDSLARINYLDGNGEDALRLLWGLEKVKKEMLKQSPELEMFYPLLAPFIEDSIGYTVDMAELLRQQMEGTE